METARFLRKRGRVGASGDGRLAAPRNNPDRSSEECPRGSDSDRGGGIGREKTESCLFRIAIGAAVFHARVRKILRLNPEAIESQSVYLLSSGSEQGGDLGEYALKEEGTFTNAISGETSALVRKKWTNLPTDYPSDDLPSVTFSLYQGLEGDSDEKIVEKKAYATLTVTSDQWKSLAKEGAYTFSFVYAGENKIEIRQDGSVVTVPGTLSAGADPATAEKLPKFDEEGKLYKYVLREKITVNDGEGAPGQNDVYGSPVISGYEVTNPYDSKKGSLAFRKYLKLPMNADDTAPEAYPAVEFEISRSYETNEGNGAMSDPEVISVTYNEKTGRWEKASSGGGNLVWSSAEVEKAYEAQSDAAPKDPMVSSDFTVDGLEIYAPNGSEYVYTVTEVKDELQGYETWAVKEAVSKALGTGIADDRFHRLALRLLIFAQKQHGDAIIAGRRQFRSFLMRHIGEETMRDLCQDAHTVSDLAAGVFAGAMFQLFDDGQCLLHQHMLTLSVHADDRADAAGILLHLFLSLIFILIHDLNSFLTAAAAVIGQHAGARVIDITAFPAAIRHPEITHHL